MTKPWIDLILKIAVEVVDFVANMLKEDKEGKKDEPKGTSKTK
jgi:hypothetical protein